VPPIHEGIARAGSDSVFEHGWVVWRGRIVELTLPDAEPIAGYAVSTEVMRSIVLTRSAWGSNLPGAAQRPAPDCPAAG